VKEIKVTLFVAHSIISLYQHWDALKKTVIIILNRFIIITYYLLFIVMFSAMRASVI